MIPLAAQRGGGLTWEYYFNFDGGRPPWTSAMSQGTGLEALSRAFRAFHDPSYLDVARRALPIFSVRPPVGVRIPTSLGTRYLQYSFAPGASIINAFLQTLIGLYDYAKVSGNPQATALFNAGNAEALAEVPRFDTGAWSLYQPGLEDTLGYHQLVTGFLQQLCTRTAAPVYCTTAQHFQADLTTPPALSLLTDRARIHRPTSIRFRLSKVSHVGIVVLAGNTTAFSTSATFAHGVGAFSIPPPKRTPASTPCSSPPPTWPATSTGSSGRSRFRAERARSGRNTRLGRGGAAHDPLHGQGGRRQDVGRGVHGATLRGRGAADAGDLDRSGAQPVRVARGRARRRADRGRRPPLGPGGQGPGRDGAPLVRRPGMARRAVHRARRRPHLRRGADRAAGDGRAVLAAAAPAPPPVRRVGGDRRRLRADRRDAAPAVVPGRRAVVDRQGVPLRASDPRRGPADRALAAGHPAAEQGGVRRRRAALAEPDRDERDPPRPGSAARSGW